jgi:hypothetical protein
LAGKLTSALVGVFDPLIVNGPAMRAEQLQAINLLLIGIYARK